MFLFLRQVLSYRRKKVKASVKNMKKYKDFYKKQKRRHEEALQKYQENHMDEMEIINLHKRCNNTKATARTVAKLAKKAPKSGYHLF